MSNLELNKIIAATLVASIIAMLVGMIANALYKPTVAIKQRGYHIAITNNSDSTQQETAKEVEFNVAELMKTANAEMGKDIIKKCVSCHAIDANGANKVGPHLWNVVNRNKAAVSDYKYSAAMKAKDGKWDEESLFHFLHKPSKYVPGTKMSFAGLNKIEDIVNLIAFLKKFVHD